jgi:hypothetical protein
VLSLVAALVRLRAHAQESSQKGLLDTKGIAYPQTTTIDALVALRVSCRARNDGQARDDDDDRDKPLPFQPERETLVLQ